jgi:hypothetical protein
MRLLLSTITVLGLVTFTAPAAEAKGDSKAEAEPPARATPNNACGCYRDTEDNCHCERLPRSKLKCECEGDCEPPECVAKRRRDEEKAAAAALKKIKEKDKKAQAESRKAMAEREKARAAEKSKKDKAKAKEGGDPRWKE